MSTGSFIPSSNSPLNSATTAAIVGASAGTSSSGSSSSSTSTTAAGSNNSLTAKDFINMMLTELQNQDPLQPTDTSALLTQISQVGQLESTTSLQTSITSLALQNSIGAASALIGKSVTGTDTTGKIPLSGIVNSIQVSGGNVSLQLDSGSSMPLANVLTITPVAATAAAGATGTSGATAAATTGATTGATAGATTGATSAGA